MTMSAFIDESANVRTYVKNFSRRTGHPHSYPIVQRLKGFQDAMAQAELQLPEPCICTGDWEYSSGYECTEKLPELTDRPTAVFAMNDLMVSGCIHAVCDRRLRVPFDMTIVGFDNREIAQYLQPPLTIIALPTAEIGEHAAKHILAMIQNADIRPEREIIRCRVIERQSV